MATTRPPEEIIASGAKVAHAIYAKARTSLDSMAAEPDPFDAALKGFAAERTNPRQALSALSWLVALETAEASPCAAACLAQAKGQDDKAALAHDAHEAVLAMQRLTTAWMFLTAGQREGIGDEIRAASAKLRPILSRSH